MKQIDVSDSDFEWLRALSGGEPAMMRSVVASAFERYRLWVRDVITTAPPEDPYAGQVVDRLNEIVKYVEHFRPGPESWGSLLRNDPVLGGTGVLFHGAAMEVFFGIPNEVTLPALRSAGIKVAPRRKPGVRAWAIAVDLPESVFADAKK